MKMVWCVAILFCAVLSPQVGMSLPRSCVGITAIVTQVDTVVISSACAHTNTALERSDAILRHLMSSVQRDTARIDSLVRITREAHDSALVCKNHLTAMMLLATSQAAQKLSSAENIIMFRLKVRDVQLFLTEARKYWDAQH
jgi:hypothetical protein